MSKYLISLILLSVISMGVSAQRITRQYNPNVSLDNIIMCHSLRH